LGSHGSGHLGAAAFRRSTAVPGHPVAFGRQPWRVRTGWKMDSVLVQRVRARRSLRPAVPSDRRDVSGVAQRRHEARGALRRQGDLLSLTRWHDDGCRRRHGEWVSAGIPASLFASGALLTTSRRQYAVAKDGRQFLINVALQPPAELTITVNR